MTVKKAGEFEFNLATLRAEMELVQGQQLSVKELQQLTKAGIIKKFGFVSRVKNSSTSDIKYEGRKNYKEVYNQFNENAIDLWYKEPLYGKINKYGLISGIKTSTLAPAFANKAIADAIFQYSRRYRAKKGQLLNLNLFSGFVPASTFFSDNLDVIYDTLYGETLRDLQYSKKIRNISDFYHILKEHIIKQRRPLTIPGFMESRYNPPLTSGLVYDFHDGDPTSDEEKIKFYEDPNYELFVYILNQHGFKIDPNLPWRAIADITSDKMWPYISQYQLLKYRHTTFEEVDITKVFIDLFIPHANYANFEKAENNFVNTIVSLYERFVEQYPNYYIKSVNRSSAVAHDHVTVDNALLENIPRESPSKYFEKGSDFDVAWLERYIEIRNIEKDSTTRPIKLRKIIKQAKQIYKFGVKNFSSKEDLGGFGDLAISYVEYTLGTHGIKGAPLNKSLTIHEKNPILLLNLL